MLASRVPIFQRGDSGTEPHWQKHDMVVAVLDEECPTCGAVAHELRVTVPFDVAVVVVPIGDPVAARILEGGELTAAVVVADRFGRTYAALDAHGGDVTREACMWLDAIQEQCDECGVPVEEPAEAPLADSADDGDG